MVSSKEDVPVEETFCGRMNIRLSSSQIFIAGLALSLCGGTFSHASFVLRFLILD